MYFSAIGFICIFSIFIINSYRLLESIQQIINQKHYKLHELIYTICVQFFITLVFIVYILPKTSEAQILPEQTIVSVINVHPYLKNGDTITIFSKDGKWSYTPRNHKDTTFINKEGNAVSYRKAILKLE